MSGHTAKKSTPLRGRDPNEPDFVAPKQDAQLDLVAIVRDVWRGTANMRKRRATYLPQFPKETADGYNSRINTAVLFNAFRRTVLGLVGMVTRKDPEPQDDVPEEITTAWENIDNAGRHGVVFTADVLEDAVIDGHTFIFVDRAKVDPDGTFAEELAARPYWIQVRKSQLLRWRTMQDDTGRVVLQSVAWKMLESVPDGMFGETEVLRIRQYDRDADEITFRIWELRAASGNVKEHFVEIDSGTMGIDEIPLVAVYAERIAFFVSRPPLIDLGFENIRHYQLRSDRDNTLHIAGVPIPIFTGLDEDEILGVGSDHGIILPTGGTASYLEPTGAALDETREELQDIETRMAVLGIAMLKPATRAAETAESRRLDKSEKDSALSRIARSLRDGLEEAARLHAKWLGIEDAGTFSVSSDFESLALTSNEIKILSDMVVAKQLSLETMWDLLQTGEVLPDGFDPEVERKLLADEAPAPEPEPEPEPGSTDDDAVRARLAEITAENPVEIQTLIFNKENFTRAQAEAWAVDHDFRVDKVDETENSFRLRQREPGDFQEGSFTTIEIDTGIQAVIGNTKE